MTSTVVWDLGGVVARFRPQRRLAALAAATGLAPRVVHERIWASGLDAAASDGTLDRDATWDAVLAALGHRTDRATTRRAWALAFDPDPDVLALVDATAADVALLSNNGPIVDDCLDHELAEIGRRFRTRLLSHRLGATKPSTAAFERAASALGRRPSDLALVDDDEANVAGARAAGWHAVRLTNGPASGDPSGERALPSSTGPCHRG